MYPTSARPYFGAFVRTQVRDLEDAATRVDVVADRGETGGGFTAIRKYVSLFARAIRQGLRVRPDIIHTHYIFPTTLPAILLRRLLRIPVVATSHRGDVFDMPHRSRLHFILTRYCLNRCDAVIAVSQEIRDELCSEFGVPDRKIHVIDMGFDATELPPRRERRSRVTCVFVGLSFERKGGPTLLESISLIAGRVAGKAEFVFIGEFPAAASFRIPSDDPGLVSVRGHLEHGAVLQELAGADVFVLPSQSEGLPVALLEAMAFGAVPVATAVGDITKVVRDRQTGLLVPVDDPIVLADRLIELIENEPLRVALGEAARQTVAAYDSREKARAVRTVYTKLVAR
jgi:glycosyltransferase involved in cell wall biosynthesis